VVNLARSGARAVDVVEEQLPIVDLLPRPPALVSCVVGTNDLMRNPAPPVVAGRLRRLAEHLPAGSIVATLPSASSPSVRWINRALRASLAANGHHVAELGPHLMGVRGLAADRFHPSDQGYEAWVAAFAEPLGIDRRSVPPIAAPGAA
jgi:lysophospholipase L1-like esterase